MHDVRILKVMNNATYSEADMIILADEISEAVCNEFPASKERMDELFASAVDGTGWTMEAFERLCDLRWNGPAYCR